MIQKCFYFRGSKLNVCGSTFFVNCRETHADAWTCFLAVKVAVRAWYYAHASASVVYILLIKRSRVVAFPGDLISNGWHARLSKWNTPHHKNKFLFLYCSSEASSNLSPLCMCWWRFCLRVSLAWLLFCSGYGCLRRLPAENNAFFSSSIDVGAGLKSWVVNA